MVQHLPVEFAPPTPLCTVSSTFSLGERTSRVAWWLKPGVHSWLTPPLTLLPPHSHAPVVRTLTIWSVRAGHPSTFQTRRVELVRLGSPRLEVLVSFSKQKFHSQFSTIVLRQRQVKLRPPFRTSSGPSLRPSPDLPPQYSRACLPERAPQGPRPGGWHTRSDESLTETPQRCNCEILWVQGRSEKQAPLFCDLVL
uniref:Uncharacterized protein n=1 Tax=Branchiostoma floridae TaxID=7739 RepID=C3YR40_BRAFL|eukprot:XP_002601270.1 hypothetical protein BRAFLDRAFT_95047 [Branchiostoma floridae]